jgi:hypothetical protein
LVAVTGAGATAAAFAPLPSGPREAVYVIPRGFAAGAAPAPLPARLRFTLGVRDVLVLRNEDDRPQRIGPVLLEPGQTYRVPFRSPAEFQLACSAHTSGQLTIVVEAAPRAGLARLAWRIRTMLERG